MFDLQGNYYNYMFLNRLLIDRGRKSFQNSIYLAFFSISFYSKYFRNENNNI